MRPHEIIPPFVPEILPPQEMSRLLLSAWPSPTPQ